MHRVALLSSLLFFGLTACTVSPPDPDSALFACEDNSDCASGFDCRDGFCQRDAESGVSCERAGCPESQVCVQWRNDPPTCQSRCDDRSCPNGTADACITVNGFPTPGGVSKEVRACSSCGAGCSSGEACWPTKPGGFFDEIDVTCLAGPRCFDGNGCNTGQLCTKDLDPSIDFIGLCRPNCDNCPTSASGNCVAMETFPPSGPYGVCITCDPTCPAGNICSWETGMTALACACAPDACEALGPTFRCDATSCTDSCGLGSEACRSSTACDELAGVCRLDCLLGANCSPPDACGWVGTPEGGAALLCIPDACSGCSGHGCLLEPFTLAAACSVMDNCAHDSDCSDGALCTSGFGMDPPGGLLALGQCRIPCDPAAADCSYVQNACVNHLSVDGLAEPYSCLPQPTCSPACTTGTCVFTDSTFTQTQCKLNACLTDANCVTGNEACFFAPQLPANFSLQPYGICLPVNTSCETPSVSVTNIPLFPSRSLATACLPSLHYAGQTCTGMCADPADSRCVRAADGSGDKCRPDCDSAGGRTCLPGESCVSAFRQAGGGSPYASAVHVCEPSLKRYTTGVLGSAGSWLSSVTSEMPSAYNWNDVDTLSADVDTHFHVGSTSTTPILIVNRFNEPPVSHFYTDPSIPGCTGFYGPAQVGAGELDPMGGRLDRVVVSCPPTVTDGECAEGPHDKWRVVSMRVRAPTPDQNCKSAKISIFDPTRHISHGAIGDGLIAVVREHGGSPGRQGIRIGRFVNQDGAKIAWAPNEVFIEENWEVTKLRVTRDLVAAAIRNVNMGDTRVIAAPVAPFFASGQPKHWSSAVRPFSGNVMVEGLTADEHWVAWTDRRLDNGEQTVRWIGLNLEFPHDTLGEASQITALSWANGEPFKIVRASIDGHFLVWNDRISVSDTALYALNLAKPQEKKVVLRRASPSIALPSVVAPPTLNELYIYAIAPETGYFRVTQFAVHP